MHVYEVGKLYAERTTWPELAQYNFRDGEHELVLFYDRPSSREVQAIRKARAEFALYAEGMLIALCWKFGESAVTPWSDAPYTIHLVPAEQRVPPDDAETAMLLHIVLVDASTGIIRALRAIAMPAEFAKALHAAIRAQYAMPFTREMYFAAHERLFAQFSSADLAAQSIARFSSEPKYR